MDITTNSRVVRLIKLKWRIPKSQWNKVLNNEEFKYGSYCYEPTKTGKENTKVVTLFIFVKFIRKALEWINSKHEKLKISYSCKNGKSRIVSNMTKMLPKKDLEKYNLITFNNKVIFEDALDFYMDKFKQTNNNLFMSEEDKPFKKSILKIRSILEQLSSEQKTINTSWIT